MLHILAEHAINHGQDCAETCTKAGVCRCTHDAPAHVSNLVRAVLGCTNCCSESALGPWHVSTERMLVPQGCGVGGAGFGVKNMDRKVLSAVFEVLQNHYPERMGTL